MKRTPLKLIALPVVSLIMLAPFPKAAFAVGLDDLDVTIQVIESDHIGEISHELNLPAFLTLAPKKNKKTGMHEMDGQQMKNADSQSASAMAAEAESEQAISDHKGSSDDAGEDVGEGEGASDLSPSDMEQAQDELQQSSDHMTEDMLDSQHEMQDISSSDPTGDASSDAAEAQQDAQDANSDAVDTQQDAQDTSSDATNSLQDAQDVINDLVASQHDLVEEQQVVLESAVGDATNAQQGSLDSDLASVADADPIEVVTDTNHDSNEDLDEAQ